ncbi:MAG TPA: amidohydrolase family protein [Pseudomonadales bacterium]
MQRNDSDPDGTRLPIKIDSASNGEFAPIPLTNTNRLGNRLAHENATEFARRRGLARRTFLMSSCGAASTLLAFNAAHAATGRRAGFFDVAADAALDADVAAAAVDGDEFIFDVQGHYVDPTGAWLARVPARERPFAQMPKANAAGAAPGDRSYLNNLGPQEFVKDIFLDSDTDMMVLSFVPSTPDAEPVTIEAADATRRIVDELDGTQRLLLHGRVNPNQPGDLDAMDALAERWKISAWKTYTQFGPGGRGYFLSDEPGLAMIEKARKLGVKVICVHKGLPFGPQSYEHSQCSDIGKVARQFPDVAFIVYHSGFVAGKPEVPYDHAAARDGIDTLVRSMLDNAVAPNSNVYAELGSTWRHLMKEPDSAAHALGKLFKYVGTDNVLWGTDSIWYGSPQDQIQAFRTFQIAPDVREANGYPEITPALRAKVFGYNATVPYKISAEEVQLRRGADKVARARVAYQERRDPTYRTYGPKTRREFFNLLRHGHV